ncbi:hypothetical protein [Streptomyces sp. NPDC049949]|uniref:hypothetical protein n=1 Tax=Streptomyces sp. NPDC049949 TaxID=3154627 RepID=UPI0034473DC0
MSAADIAEISGVSVTLIRRLLRPATDRPASVHRATSEAILGILPSSAFRRDRPLPGLVPAGRAAAILQNLAEHGWPTSFLASHLGTSTHTISALRSRERPRLSMALDRKIRRLAARLMASDPAEHGIAAHRSRRAQSAAARRAQVIKGRA